MEVFAAKQGRGHAILLNSGSSANLVMLQSLKSVGRLKTGAKVGFSALTWSTNVMPIIQLGFEPIPIDCEVNTLNVSSRTLLERLQDDALEGSSPTYLASQAILMRFGASARSAISFSSRIIANPWAPSCRRERPEISALRRRFHFSWRIICPRLKEACWSPMIRS